MRRHLSIRCTFAFQSIETFLDFLAWFFDPKGSFAANDLVVPEIGRASVDKVLPACPPWPENDIGLDSQKRDCRAADVATVAKTKVLP